MTDSRRIDRRILGYLRPQARPLAAGLACGAAMAGITALVGVIIKNGIEAMSAGDGRRLDLLCLAVLAVFFVNGLLYFGQSYLLALVANRVGASLRDDLFAHVHSMSLSFFARRRVGGIMSAMTNDVTVLQNAAMSLRDFVAAPISVVTCLAVLFWMSWKLTLVALIFVPAMLAVTLRISARIKSLAATVQARLSDVTAIMEETVSGVRVIKSFAAERHEVRRFSEQNHASLYATLKAEKRKAMLRPIVEFIGAFGIALVLYMSGNMIAATVRAQEHMQLLWMQAHPGMLPVPALATFRIAGAMTAGRLFAFVYLLNAVVRAAGSVGTIAATRAQALAAGHRIFDDILDIQSDVVQERDAQPIGRIGGEVRFEHVSFRYGADGLDVLSDIDLTINPGEVVAVVGRSGAGKSTLVDLVPRFYDPVEGRVCIDGHDVRGVDLEDLRSQIGIVPQETWLFAGTLRDNIRYGRRTASDEEVWAAAEAANASFIEAMPDGLDTVVGDRGVRLSGGERQRIAIARAILMNPRILILDEATSSLDASSEALVQEALDKLMRGRTTIVIAHRLSTVIGADRIVAMKDGRIVEVGTHRDLMAAAGYYAGLYETQLRGFD